MAGNVTWLLCFHNESPRTAIFLSLHVMIEKRRGVQTNIIALCLDTSTLYIFKQDTTTIHLFYLFS